MSNQILMYHNKILDILDNINNIIINTEYTDYELSINNNKYEQLNNNYLKIYESILDNANNIVKTIKKQNKKYTKYKNNFIKQFDDLLIDIDKIHTNIDNSNIIIKNNTITEIDNLYNNYQYKIFNTTFLNDSDNLDIIDDKTIITSINKKKEYDTIILPKKQLVNIGYDNYYELPVFNYLSNSIPLNTIVYVEEIKSVIIKVGNQNKFKYINATIGRVPENTIDKNNQRSIICNNNIIKYNKKCINGHKCTYYHDPIIGFSDIAHYERQYSHNPLIYNCSNFKDGKYIKENVKKINWEEGLNLYQTSFAWVLLGLIHSLE